MCHGANVHLGHRHLVDMGGQSLNTASAMGRFSLNMMAGVAELERNLIAERTTMALAHKKAHREAYAPTPYGYDREGKDLKQNDHELAVVALVKEMRDQGDTQEDCRGIERTGDHLEKGGAVASSDNQIPFGEQTL